MKSLALSKPHAIIMVGIPGAGKTHFAEKFASTFGAPFIGINHLQAIVDDQDKTEQLAVRELREIAKTKMTLVIDGLSDTRMNRSELAKTLRELEYVPLFVWVQVDHDTALQRSTRQRKDGIRTPLTADEHRKRAKRFSDPHPSEKPIVISGKHTYASQAKTVLKHLSAPRAEVSRHTKPPLERPGNRRSITISG